MESGNIYIYYILKRKQRDNDIKCEMGYQSNRSYFNAKNKMKKQKLRNYVLNLRLLCLPYDNDSMIIKQIISF